MPLKRKKFVRLNVPDMARFLTFSCYQRAPVFSDDSLCELFVTRLTPTAATRKIAILAWVLMPDHVHLVVHPEQADSIAAFLSSLKGAFASDAMKHICGTPLEAALLDRSGHPHLWEPGGGFDRCVKGPELLEKIGYTNRNPVRKELCAASADWRWSSARAYEQRPDYTGPPIAFDLLPPTDRPLT
jgi:putative transposase